MANDHRVSTAKAFYHRHDYHASPLNRSLYSPADTITDILAFEFEFGKNAIALKENFTRLTSI